MIADTKARTTIVAVKCMLRLPRLWWCCFNSAAALNRWEFIGSLYLDAPHCTMGININKAFRLLFQASIERRFGKFWDRVQAAVQ